MSKNVRQGAGGGPPLLESAHNRLVLATVGSVVLSTIVGVRFISPILHAAAILPFYYAAMRRHLHHLSIALVFRWAVTLFCSVVIVGAFVPARIAASVGVGSSTVTAMRQWLAGTGGPPADLPFLLWGMAAFLAGTAVSGGVIGFILAALSLGGTAYCALFLFEHGTNVVSVALIALPPWQWLFFAAGALLLVPTALPVFNRVFKHERVAEERDVLRKFMIAGGVSFLLSLILRLATGNMWQSLVRRFTTF